MDFSIQAFCKIRSLDLEHETEELYSRVKDLENVIEDLQSEISILKMQNEELLGSSGPTDFTSTPQTFSGGKFTDSVRQCAVLNWNVE
ncbi:MAG: hypothetical protein A6F71_10465 [Cycloclasticus sp. symbiont of Poecilosclerida sp. M]|nr:MAG: hypothetical protein A6F71_10465 [Cycloclasticus sp. symbiont of Poecilosclerida sp. M]